MTVWSIFSEQGCWLEIDVYGCKLGTTLTSEKDLLKGMKHSKHFSRGDNNYNNDFIGTFCSSLSPLVDVVFQLYLIDCPMPENISSLIRHSNKEAVTYYVLYRFLNKISIDFTMREFIMLISLFHSRIRSCKEEWCWSSLQYHWGWVRQQCFNELRKRYLLFPWVNYQNTQQTVA